MRTRHPAIIHMNAAWYRSLTENSARLADGRYVPARPLPFVDKWTRLRAAWLVFRGKADALIWEGQ